MLEGFDMRAANFRTACRGFRVVMIACRGERVLIASTARSRR